MIQASPFVHPCNSRNALGSASIVRSQPWCWNANGIETRKRLLATSLKGFAVHSPSVECVATYKACLVSEPLGTLLLLFPWLNFIMEPVGFLKYGLLMLAIERNLWGLLFLVASVLVGLHSSGMVDRLGQECNSWYSLRWFLDWKSLVRCLVPGGPWRWFQSTSILADIHCKAKILYKKSA